jgi:DUF1365 family protein
MTNPRDHDAPAALYRGDVMHARLKPKPHRFTYRFASLLIDLDRLDAADRLTPLFGVNRRALYAFHEKDHGPRDGSSLSAYVRDTAQRHGLDLSGGRTTLLCYPRLFGHVFNPLSVYFCYDAHGTLALLIYEVRNTFRETHSYVLPVSAHQRTDAGIRQSQDKQFYVSPFIAMDMRYHFRISPPDDDVKLRILETDAEGPLLAATFHGHRAPLSTPSLLRLFAALPFMTLKIVGGILFEAARLWLKGIRLVSRPQGPPAAVQNPADPRHSDTRKAA